MIMLQKLDLLEFVKGFCYNTHAAGKAFSLRHNPPFHPRFACGRAPTNKGGMTDVESVHQYGR